ncbi:ATP-binding cassette domain-containing protein [archaeon]|nr:MAG: ATP-binding cassette domain-containing protein [archaeon]
MHARSALRLRFCPVAAFSSFAEIPPAIETRAVAYKHFAWKGYSPTSYMLAYVVVSLPIAILETLGFCAILYFMSGLAPDAGRFFFFTLILCLIDVAMATCFRMVAYMSARLDLAQALTGPIISIQVIFAGYLITFKKIPAWLIWLYWSSPFAWALRAVARSEATSGPYQRLMPDGRTTLGEAALQFFEIQTESKYQWGAIGVIIAFFCVCCVLTAILLDKVRFDDSIGTRRPVHAAIPSPVAFVVDAVSVALVDPHTRATSVASGTASPTTAPALASARGVRDEEDGVLPAPSTTGIRTGVSGVGSAVSSTDTSGVDSRQSAGGTAMGALPFSPVTLTFSHVRYSVVVAPLPGEVAEQPSPHVWRRLRKPSRNRTLLHNVHGYALPGTLTFLMGASGAGKTTLLDCLAGRKTSGSLTGSILFNGVPMNANTLRRCAYVEQQDMHMPYATVREALLFSATLRLPADTPTPVRDAFVDQILHLLELHTVQDRLIGYSDVDGLAAGQRKRLTIGVELCSNAPLIFLDEPTTGLDSRAAAVVMRVVRNIAATGRTVVSTIHQPSEEVFLQADNLLLLQSGGWQVYMGALGRRGSAVVDFLQRASPGTPRKPRKLNPASWMLDVLMNQLWPPAALKAGASLAPLPTASRAHEAMRAIEMVPVSVVTAQVAPGHGGNACTITPASPRVGPEERTTTDADTRDAVTALVADGCTDVYALAYAGSGLAAQNIRALAAANETFKTPDVSVVHMQQPVYARSFGVQLSTLLQRLWLSYNRDKPKNLTRFVALLGLALTFGTIYYRVTDADGAGVQSKIAVIFLSVAFCGVMNYNTGLPSSPNLGVIVHRERSSRMYHASANTIASLLIEIPWTAAASLMFTAITYFMVGLRSDAAVFFHYYFILFLVSLIFNYVAQCLVSVTPNVAVAQAVAGLIMSLWFLFGM